MGKAEGGNRVSGHPGGAGRLGIRFKGMGEGREEARVSRTRVCSSLV